MLQKDVRKYILESEKHALEKYCLERDMQTCREVIEKSAEHEEQLKLKDQLIVLLEAKKSVYREKAHSDGKCISEMEQDTKTLKNTITRNLDEKEIMVLLTQNIADLKSEKEDYLQETQKKDLIIPELMHDILTLRYILKKNLDESNIPDLFLSIDNLKLSAPRRFIGTIKREKLKKEFDQNAKEIKLENDKQRRNRMGLWKPIQSLRMTLALKFIRIKYAT